MLLSSTRSSNHLSDDNCPPIKKGRISSERNSVASNRNMSIDNEFSTDEESKEEADKPKVERAVRRRKKIN